TLTLYSNCPASVAGEAPLSARHKSGELARSARGDDVLSVCSTYRLESTVGRTPGSAGDPLVAKPTLDHRYWWALATSPARTGFSSMYDRIFSNSRSCRTRWS